MTCAEVRELLEAYALGALETGEAKKVRDHLKGCVECTREFRQFELASALLPDALVEASPTRAPGSLKGRLLYSVARESRGRRSAIIAPHLFTLKTLGPALALILLALSLAWALHQTDALARERSLRNQLTGQIDQQELIFEVVDSNRTSKVLMRATQPGSTSYGKIYTRPDLPDVVALAGRLPLAPEGQVYHLWLTTNSGSELAGTMKVNDEGFGLLVYHSGRNGLVFESAQVVLENEDSSAPTGNAVVRWDSPR